MKKLIYPACFYPCLDKQGTFTVIVPDLKACISNGNSLEEAFANAIDYASDCVLDEMEEGNPIPKATNIKNIQLQNPDGFTSLLILDMDTFIETHTKKIVLKDLTIPAWLNYFVKKNRIDLSRVLQNALISIYETQTTE